MFVSSTQSTSEPALSLTRAHVAFGCVWKVQPPEKDLHLPTVLKRKDSEASLQSESNFSRHSMSLEEEDKAPKRDSFVGGNRDSSSMPSTPAVPARKGSLLTSSLPPGLQHNQGSAERLTLEERFNVMYESSSSIGESQTDNESVSTVIPDTNQAQPFRAVRPSPRRGTALAGG
jgi:hypothetical protein